MKIFILPSEYSGDPEAAAMLQAFYSRSFQGIEERLENLGGDLTKVKKALNSYYIGYGHASIGDCGHVTLFIEGVSILAAKAIQDNPLYSGQESSTRYIDFLKSGCVNFFYEAEADIVNSIQVIQKKWLDTYSIAKTELETLLRASYAEEHGYSTEDIPAQALKAITARSFDIARSLIPAGARTNLSVHMSLRKAVELFQNLKDSDNLEFKNIGKEVLTALQENYPAAVPAPSEGKAKPFIHNAYRLSDEDVFSGVVLNNSLTEQARSILDNRAKYEPVDRSIGSQFIARINSKLDYGSYRDIQRHRNGYMSPVQLSLDYGFSQWYLSFLDQLSEDFKVAFNEANRLLNDFNDSFGTTGFVQYCIPLGYNVQFEMVWGLDQIVYVAELRSGETVHPTARKFGHHLAMFLSHNGIKHYCNMTEDVGISLRRGAQDIVKKESL